MSWVRNLRGLPIVGAGNPTGPAKLRNGEKMGEEKNKNVEGKKEFKLSDHFLVPKHEILSEKEKEEVLKKYNISEKQLPKILYSDPIIKEIGAKVGDLIKITRNSRVAGKTIYYRLVSR